MLVKRRRTKGKSIFQFFSRMSWLPRYNLRVKPVKRARKRGKGEDSEKVDATPTVWIMRMIFAYCGSTDRSAIFRVCRLWRQNYLWVAPRESYRKALMHRNTALAKQLWSFSNHIFQADCFKTACEYGQTSHVNEMLAGTWLTSNHLR